MMPDAGSSRRAPEASPDHHWFEPIADHLGPAYLRYSFTKGTDQEVVDEREVGVGRELAAVDAALEHLPHRGPPRHEVLAHVGLGQRGVVDQIGDQRTGDPPALG